MRFHLSLAVFFAGLISLGINNLSFSAEKYPDRWFYASFGLQNEEAADELIELINSAGSKDLNGMLWACGLEHIGSWSPSLKGRLAKIKKAADEKGIEIIPILWSVGYGTMLHRNPNLAASKPVDLEMIAQKGKIVCLPDPIGDLNSGMETIKGKQIVSFYHDRPGTVSFIDNEIKHGGNNSVRFENFSADQHGHGRLSKTLTLKPNRMYCISIWMKTEEIKGGRMMLQMYRQKGGITICSNGIKIPKNGTSDWTQRKIFFNSGPDGLVRFYAGIWGGKSGKFWFDDFELTDLALCNPVQRPGTPLIIKNQEDGTEYEEGRDYLLPKSSLNLGNPVKGKVEPIIPENSRIKEGTKLSVHYYTPVIIGNGQISVCMSEPELYKYFEKSAEALMKELAPKKWFLSMDEIRAGGSCKACKDRNLSMGRILGDCITKQFEIIKKVQPNAEVYIWSDMIDPNHNCRDNYYNVEGDFTGAWKYIPKDLIVACWYYEKREASMKFFAENGFRTFAAAYYDTDNLNSCSDWLDTCNRTPNCTGIMYTTWQHKYALFPGFCDLVREQSKPMKK
ncbi:MAG: hypothetical protein Q4G69_06430 [Planctomycetia bacterium]|nr:hypothetical protein [Planctomycetia bacterium]